jgi:hypothetical protein
MTRKRNLAVLLLVGLAAVLIAAPWSIVAGNEGNEAARVNFAGAWVDVSNTGARAIYHVTANDSAGNSLSGIGQLVESNPTFYGYCPDAEALTDFVGAGVRTGPDSVDHTWIGYATKKNVNGTPKIAYIWVISGSLVAADANTLDSVFTLAVFGADADANGDGFPDEGQAPIVAVPGSSIVQRLPLIPLAAP